MGPCGLTFTRLVYGSYCAWRRPRSPLLEIKIARIIDACRKGLAHHYIVLTGPGAGCARRCPGQIAAAPDVRENLEYQISLGPWSDVARVHLVLKELKPGHYLAEFSGAAQGMWKLLSRWLPERYQTEMVYRDGRLQARGVS